MYTPNSHFHIDVDPRSFLAFEANSKDSAVRIQNRWLCEETVAGDELPIGRIVCCGDGEGKVESATVGRIGNGHVVRHVGVYVPAVHHQTLAGTQPVHHQVLAVCCLIWSRWQGIHGLRHFGC